MPSRSARGTNGRMVEVDGVAHAWSSNWEMLGDGQRTYSYDHSGRLSSVVVGQLFTPSPTLIGACRANGNRLGNRLRQTTNGYSVTYTLDLNAGLTQVLGDGTNAYLYGLSRVGRQAHSSGLSRKGRGEGFHPRSG
jgi:hypothetical protein